SQSPIHSSLSIVAICRTLSRHIIIMQSLNLIRRRRYPFLLCRRGCGVNSTSNLQPLFGIINPNPPSNHPTSLR
ncbi:hypothetical protein LINPERPRIM_LOCUS10921, partial [Linum perenne]